jgi:hypothetical protein
MDQLLITPSHILVCDKHSVDNEQAMKMCPLGQKQILTELDLDGTKAALRFIDKQVY